MSQAYILAIDQGTTNTKALLIDETGTIVSSASQQVQQSYPRSAWVEQDALEIWQSVQFVIDRCLEGHAVQRLAALAISNQRESVMLWERQSGTPLGPCIGWQCRRTASTCEELKARGMEPLIRERTGLMIDPLFSATKARWLLDHVEAGQQRAKQGELCLGTVDSWLLWNLTGGTIHGCDISNAARTQLFNIRQLCWDDDLLDLFGIPLPALPVVRPSSFLHGQTTRMASLPANIPVASMIGDSHAALFALADFRPGVVKATYGTGSSLMTPLQTPLTSEHGLATTIAWAREDEVTYALEGNIPMTGAAVQWLGTFLGLADPTRDVADLAATVTDSGGLYFVPAFVGLGAPHWMEAARGLMTGFTQGSTPAHLARATLEAIAYQVRDVFDAVEEEIGTPLRVLFADGGASQNDLLMQFQSDILGRPVLRSASPDASALGAAFLAGLAVGVWSSQEEISRLPGPRARFNPRMTEAERERLYAGWQKALTQTMLGTEEYTLHTRNKV